MSTLWWAERAHTVVAVENDRSWYDEVQRRHLKSKEGTNNIELLYAGEQYEYASAIRMTGRTFDVVIVDGASNRFLCARQASAARMMCL